MKGTQTRPAMRGQFPKPRVGTRELAVSVADVFRQRRGVVVQEGRVVLQHRVASTATGNGIGERSPRPFAVAQFDDGRRNANADLDQVLQDHFRGPVAGTVLDSPQRPDPHPFLKGAGRQRLSQSNHLLPFGMKNGSRSVPGRAATVHRKQQVAEQHRLEPWQSCCRRRQGRLDTMGSHRAHRVTHRPKSFRVVGRSQGGNVQSILDTTIRKNKTHQQAMKIWQNKRRSPAHPKGGKYS